MRRVETRNDAGGTGRSIDGAARLAALQRAWDSAISGYRCYYTGVPLNDRLGSRRYATWEHLMPGDEASLVLVADLVNRMKSDMTDAEFRGMVAALAGHFGGSEFDHAAFPDDPP